LRRLRDAPAFAGGRTSPLVASFRNRADETTLFGYDALGRLVSKDMPGAELDISFGYDLLGRTIGASQAGDSQVYDYDALGRQLSQAGASGTYSSRYDPAGRRTRITHPDGFFVTQEYLVTGEMTKIRENGGFVLAAFDYDDLGRRDRLVLGNGAVTDYGYDAVSRLETLGHDFAGTASDNLVTFTYNAASQIETRLATNDLYAWTGHGNGTTTYVADGLNRLTSQTTAGLGTTSFVHDARGNRLNDGARTYGYDSENKSRGATTAPYHYDPLGRLSGALNSPGTPPAIAYESYIDRLVAERTPGTLTPQRRHVFGPGVDEPLVWYEGSDRRFLSADERGSIVAVSDGSGVVRNVNRYDEYGQTQRTDPYYLSRFGFTGQRYFGGHGLYHYKNRMYDPKTGRFMQPDPIGYGGGMNLYAYVGGDPVNFTDPLGLAGFGSCTGTRICPDHDSGGTGPGTGVAQLFGGRGNGGGSGNWGGRKGNGPPPNPQQSTTTQAPACTDCIIVTATIGQFSGFYEQPAQFFLTAGNSDWVSDWDLPPYAHILKGRRVKDPRTGYVSLVNIPANYRPIPAPRGGGYLLVPPGWTPGSRVNIIRIQPPGTGSVAHNPRGYFVVYGQSGSALNIRTGAQVKDTAPEAHNPLGGVIPPFRLW
jgi:RHS repeat-associated protein